MNKQFPENQTSSHCKWKHRIHLHTISKIFLCFLLVSSCVGFFKSQPIAQIYANTKTAVFTIQSTMIPAAAAGTNLSYDLEVRNVGNDLARDVVVSFSLPDTTPLESTSIVTSKLIPTFSEGSVVTVPFKYRIKSSAKIGVYPVVANYKFKNSLGEQLESNETFYIRVLDIVTPLSIQLTSVRSVPTSIIIGNSFEIQMEVTNKSTQPISNVDIWVEGLSPSTFMTSENPRKSTSVLSPGEKKLITFKMNSSDKLEYGSHSLTMKYSYQDPAYGYKEESQDVFIQALREMFTSVQIQNIVVPNSSIPAGEPFDVSFELENKTLRALENITVSVDGGDKIIPISYSLLKTDYLEQSAKKTYQFKFQSLENIPPRPYVLNIDVKYLKKGSTTEFETYRQTVTVDITKSADLVTNNVSIPYSIREEQDFEFSFDLKNVGFGGSENIKSVLELSKGILALSSTQVNVAALKPTESTRIKYKLRTTKITEEGIYPLVIKVYSDSSIEPQIMNYGVYVQRSENAKMIPRVILNGYSLSEPSIQAGSNFQIQLNLVNTSIVKAVGNIKVTVSSEEVNDKNVILGSIFVPVQSSSTFYIPKLSPQQGLTKTLNYRVLSNAESKNYFMILNLEYEDEQGNAIKEKETITIPVEQKAQYFMTEVFTPPGMMVQNEYPFTVKFYNTGRVPLTNFKVQAEGDFTIDTMPYFTVSMAPGSEDSYEFTVIPTQSGNQSGKLLISYQESNGEIKQIEKQFSFTVQDLLPTDPSIDNLPIEDSSGFKLMSAGNLILFLLIVTAGFTAYKIRARRKKKAEFNE